MKKNNLIKSIFSDFEGKVGSRSVKVKFKNKISKSDVFVSKLTGTVYHSPNISALKGVEGWSKKIYSKKLDPKNIKYTGNNRIQKTRYYYAALFLNEIIDGKKKIRFCDYATGEGYFGLELLRLYKNLEFNFTEHSPTLFKDTVKRIKKISKYKFFTHKGSIESSIINKKLKNLDCASLLWTLSACVKPLDIMNTIHSSLKKDGYLLISDSSRIMVPYKKPIYNFFVKNDHSRNTHPFFFSYNSLSNLLEVSGFRIIKSNRYYDENDLVIIAQKKNKKTHKPKILVDKHKRVLKFLKDWEKVSFELKDNY